MVERIRGLIERFPENEQAIRHLIESDSLFDVLCDEYRQIAEELRGLGQKGDEYAAEEAQGLKMRREAVEEQLLTKIEGCKPV
ncbi:MAG: hypothetical protein OEM59_19410 [Rhodospirillales bacterium]|nr:hypothetical protein [Rhodospirillales bacterium]